MRQNLDVELAQSTLQTFIAEPRKSLKDNDKFKRATRTPERRQGAVKMASFAKIHDLVGKFGKDDSFKGTLYTFVVEFPRSC